MKEEIWIIRDKKTKETWMTKNGKFFWKKQAHAKNAWAYNFDHLRFGRCDNIFEVLSEIKIKPVESDVFKGKFRAPYFDEQDSYELVNVASEKSVSKELFDECLELLRLACKFDLDHHRELKHDIDAFLERFE